MNKKIQMALAASACALAIGAAQAQSGGISDNVVKVGVLTDMSGPYSAIGGQGSVTAARMAVEDFIAARKPAYKVEVVFADHQNKSDIAAGKTREWYDRDGVDMVTDGLNSAVALAVSRISAEKNRIMINVGAGTTRLTNEDCTPNTAHWAYDTYALATGTARAMVKQGGTSWFFVTVDYAFGASMEKDAMEVINSAGGKIVGSVKHPLNASDFSSFLLQAQASNAKVIALASAGGDTINAIKTAAEFGINKKQTLAPLLLSINDIHALGLPTAQGLVLTEGFYWDLNDDTRAWSRRYFSRMKSMPSMLQAGVYSAVSHYLNAVAASGTDTAAVVMKRMKDTPVNDMFAKNGKLRDDGRMVHDMYLMQVKRPADSRQPWDYYNVLATIKGDDAFQPMSRSRCPLIKK